MSANGLTPVRFPYRLTRLLESPLGRRAHAAFSSRLITYDRIQRIVAATLPAGAELDAAEAEWLYLLAGHYHYRFPPPPLLDDDIRQLTVSTMLLMGQRERFFSVPGVIERATRLLPNLDMVRVIARAGHSIITEQPEVVNTHLREFLSS
jgi:pimeloyl-ACP methyl ester carboxylesterase